jgi:hypothetical protein
MMLTAGDFGKYQIREVKHDKGGLSTAGLLIRDG